ncbi:hypothetical protein Mal35_30750 [Gimesia maris]|nr:hypothetical protein Mal35_30750 [Gimesia maris]
MRLLANHPIVLTCVCCLLISGCAVNQGAHFSVAPEYDHARYSAISKAMEARSQDSPQRTIDDVKSNSFRVTGFNKFNYPAKPLDQSLTAESIQADKPVVQDLEFDEASQFHSIELVEASFATIDEPVEAQKPVLEKPEMEFVLDPRPMTLPTVPPAPASGAALPGSKQEKQKSVSPHLVELGLKPLTELTLNTKPPTGDLPANTAGAQLEKIPVQQVVMGTTRDWSLTTKEWEAPAIPYNPLYFEEPYLERYGYNYGPAIQPFISAGRFFGRVPALPYMIGAYPIHECQYDLGYERPGDCPPYQVERLPFSARGALFESLTVTGLIFLIP